MQKRLLKRKFVSLKRNMNLRYSKRYMNSVDFKGSETFILKKIHVSFLKKKKPLSKFCSWATVSASPFSFSSIELYNEQWSSFDYQQTRPLWL